MPLLAEAAAEDPAAVGLGRAAAAARLERRLDLDAVDRADLAVRSELGGVCRIDLGAELDLDRRTVAALDRHRDGALAAQLARHGALLGRAGRGHVLEADVHLRAGARDVSRQLVLEIAAELFDVVARHLHLGRGGRLEPAALSLDGRNRTTPCHQRRPGRTSCLARRRSRRLSPRREAEFIRRSARRGRACVRAV